MGARVTMDEYLLWGALALLVVVLIATLLLRGRRASVPRRAQPAEAVGRVDDASARLRAATPADAANVVLELEAPSDATVDALQVVEREAAEQAARAEADREAAEWEARLVAQLLADQERERAAVIAERVAAETAAEAALRAPPEPDEQALRAQADREAAEWEARLVAQQRADEEHERERARVEVERLAVEAAGAARLQRAIDAHAALEHAAQERFERAATAQLARLEAQRVARTAAQAEAARLAAVAAAVEAAALSVPPAPAVVAALSPRTPEQCLVMIADDSKVVRIKTSRLLAKHLYRVSLAEDGLDAARQIEIDLPDVLITDVEMPGMDGFELTRQVRSNPRTAHIPIVMITADDDKHRAGAAEAGVSVLLSKPYPEDQLLAYLQSTLARAEVH